MSTIPSSEKAQINELRNKVSDLLRLCPEYDLDFNLLRWLQGHDFNMDVVVPKLRHHLRFYKAAGLGNYEKIIEERNQLITKCYPFGIVGPTGKGDNNIVFIEAFGCIDGIPLLKSVTALDFVLNRVYGSETILRTLQTVEAETGRQSKLVFILDAGGDFPDTGGATFTLGQAIEFMMKPYRCTSDVFSRHYVEMVHKFVVINSASLYYAWKAISLFLPTKTRNKVEILGTNWKQEILEYVDRDHLPMHWGGTMVDADGDPYCRSKIVIPAKVPEASKNPWADRAEEYLDSLSQKQMLNVVAGKVKFRAFYVADKNSTLSWIFYAGGTYSFGIYFTENEKEKNTDEMECVFPFIDLVFGPSYIPEVGSIRCDKPGYYKIRFGNEGAWISPLMIKYIVTVN